MYLSKRFKTSFLSSHDIKRETFFMDAKGMVLGRLASFITSIIRGKHRPFYSTHLNCGDCIVIINASQIALTGEKKVQRQHYRHTGYPGGIKVTTPEKILIGKNPIELLKQAVLRMIRASGPYRDAVMRNLKIYPHDQHPHTGLVCKKISFELLNRKNSLTQEEK
jgi:large subunit ribosomal protein L13